MELTQEQKKELENWLSEQPENVRDLAEHIIVLMEKYRDIRISNDIDNKI